MQHKHVRVRSGWALAVTTSRAFAVRGPTKPRALLPVIDMCNHSFQPNCDIRKEADGAITLFATRDVQAGEQLVLSYGPLDNHTLLLDYGFCVADNPYDNVALNVSAESILVRSARQPAQILRRCAISLLASDYKHTRRRSQTLWRDKSEKCSRGRKSSSCSCGC